MTITHADERCGCPCYRVGLAARKGEAVTLSAAEAKALSHEMARLVVAANKCHDVAMEAMKRVGELEAEAAPNPEAVVH